MKRWLAAGALLMVVSACRHLFGQPAATASVPIAREAASAATALLDLNLATGTELRGLPEIGPVMAAKILQLREQMDGFERVDQLMLAPGMSERKFKKIAPFVRVEVGRRL